jgi:hypothetical protein
MDPRRLAKPAVTPMSGRSRSFNNYFLKEQLTMRIVDAEPQLVQDFLGEIEVVVSKEKPSLKVYAGRHPTLGKVVIVDSEHGDSIIVEMEE